jgi:hypothetical protein
MRLKPQSYPVELVRPTVLAEMLAVFGNTTRRAILLAAALDAAVSLCTSANARVRREDGTAGPVFDFGLLVSPTGAGKSHQDRRVKPAIKSFIEQHSAVSAEQLSRLECQNITQKSKERQLGSKIGKDFVDELDVTNDEERLTQLIASRPKDKSMPDWLFEETTLQALLRGVHNFPVAAVWVDDAAHLLESLIRQALSIVAKLWDDGTLAHNRVKGRMRICTAITFYLTVQNEIYADFLVKNGKKLVASGVAGRFMPYVVTADMMGDDHSDDLTDENGVGERFAKRVHELLAQAVINAENGLTDLPVLELSDGAKLMLTEFRRKAQGRLREPEYADSTGFVAKMPDHALRLAARWHLFEGIQGELSQEYLADAIGVVTEYHLPTYRLLHTKPQHDRDEVRHAQALLDILYDHRGNRPLLRTELRNLALNKGISSVAAFENALGLLGADGKVYISAKGYVRLELPHHAPVGQYSPPLLRNGPERYVPPNMASDRWENPR